MADLAVLLHPRNSIEQLGYRFLVTITLEQPSDLIVQRCDRL